MPCKECKCPIPDRGDVELIEMYQSMIDELYSKSPILKEEIVILKMEHERLLKKILDMFEETKYWINTVRRVLLKDANIPVDWYTSKRLEGEKYAEITD